MAGGTAESALAGAEQGRKKRCWLATGGVVSVLGVAAVVVGIVFFALSDDKDDGPTHSSAASDAPAPVMWPNATVILPELGTIHGVKMMVDNGQELQAFLGIPYAKPPVGALRWREPEDVEPWGVKNASQFGNVCPAALCGVPATESEDCLFMNIYRPHKIAEEKLPVYIFIYGGGFNIGCSNDKPIERFVAAAAAEGKPFIGVSFNYRGGILGFLGSEELRDNDASKSTGNYGIQDQRKAMEFVRKHITHWGGDASRVTLGGNSAGACSISAHLVMPKSMADYEGGKLFSAAIIQSGFAPNWMSKPLRLATEVYEEVKAFVSCTDVACLREKPADAFTPVLMKFAYQDGPTMFQGLPFAPTIDGVELTAHPAQLIREGKHLKVPVLSGSAREEMAFFFTLYNSPDANATEQDFDLIMAPYVRRDRTAEDLAALKALYHADAHDYPDHSESNRFSFWWWATTRALSDATFVCPDRQASISFAGAVSHVYRYMFVNEPLSPSTLLGWMTGPDVPYVATGVGLFYKFNCTQPAPNCKFTEESEAKLSAKVMSSWAEFLTTRKLSNPWSQQGSSNSEDRTLLLDVEPDNGVGWVIENRVRGAECDLWEDILQATLL